MEPAKPQRAKRDHQIPRRQQRCLGTLHRPSSSHCLQDVSPRPHHFPSCSGSGFSIVQVLPFVASTVLQQAIPSLAWCVLSTLPCESQLWNAALQLGMGSEAALGIPKLQVSIPVALCFTPTTKSGLSSE